MYFAVSAGSVAQAAPVYAAQQRRWRGMIVSEAHRRARGGAFARFPLAAFAQTTFAQAALSFACSASKSTGVDSNAMKSRTEMAWKKAMGRNRESAQFPPVMLKK